MKVITWVEGIGEDMNSYKKVKWKRRIKTILPALGIVIIGIVGMIFISKSIFANKKYFFPDKEKNIHEGIPEAITLEEITVRKGFRVGFQNPVVIDESGTWIYIVNYEDNDVDICIRGYDKDDNLLWETGLVPRGYYMEYVASSENKKEMKDNLVEKIKILAFDTQESTSEGSITIKVQSEYSR